MSRRHCHGRQRLRPMDIADRIAMTYEQIERYTELRLEWLDTLLERGEISHDAHARETRATEEWAERQY